MKKVIVIGSPGSGKSTFSKKLAEVVGLPLFHLDLIWHKPDRTTVTRDEFDSRLEEILNRDLWIIDGNYSRTVERRLSACDTVFLFDLPLAECLQGALARVGKKRDDMPWVEERLDEEFKAWIEAFPKKELPKIYGLLSHNKDKQIHIFKSREAAEDFLSSLS